ncbi:MAG: class I SAM-dependent methyltransferase [Spirochaetales bacterium]|nr:class I SAM-dependent methyltransferase [Spirochaetales bacterium]MCF7937708.1 class I SAM-dependent methyltransferase [Spirochaetales bacterium]
MEQAGRDLLKKYFADYFSPGVSCLEVGAGRGDLIEELHARYGGEAWGIDPFIPRRDYPGITFVDIPAEEINTLNKSFDIIYSVYALHHFHDVEQFLASMKAVLKPAGVFIFVDWREGVRTGVDERYFEPNMLFQMIAKDGYRLLEKGSTDSHLYVVGRKG